MTDPIMSNIAPERATAAQQVGAVFNSLHSFLNSICHKNEAGETLVSESMRNARARLQEASHWAVNHVLMHGTPAPLGMTAAPEGGPVDEAKPTDTQSPEVGQTSTVLPHADGV